MVKHQAPAVDLKIVAIATVLEERKIGITVEVVLEMAVPLFPLCTIWWGTPTMICLGGLGIVSPRLFCAFTLKTMPKQTF